MNDANIDSVIVSLNRSLLNCKDLKSLIVIGLGLNNRSDIDQDRLDSLEKDIDFIQKTLDRSIEMKMGNFKNHVSKPIAIDKTAQSLVFCKRPIEFVKLLNNDSHCFEFSKKYQPRDFQYVELLSRRFDGFYDLITAYNDESNRFSGSFYLGKWNDGFCL